MNPVPYPILPVSELIPLITEKYGFKNVICELIVRGVGDTYSVESNQHRYILRFYRPTHRSLPQIEEETRLLTALKQADVSVSYPIADLSGGFIQSISAADGIRHAVLFSYAPGTAMPILNENQLRDLGHEMARFHNVSSTIKTGKTRWTFDTETTLFKPLEILKPFFSEEPESYTWLLSAAKKASEKLSTMDTSEFSKGYCHFDFLPKNFHFEGDKVTFFDFDFLGYGWLINDVMTFWQHLCLDVHFGKMTQDAADMAYVTFLDAYREYRVLNEQELAAVPYLSLGFWLFYSGFHTTHDQFHTYIQPSHLKLRTGLIRQLMERYWPKES